MIIISYSRHLFLVFACSFLIKNVGSDVFTAVVKLEYLVKVEEKMIDALAQYMIESVAANEQVPDSIKTFLAEAREQNKQALQPHFIENPINAFHFVKRMTDWNDVFTDINCEDCLETQAVKNLNLSISVIRHKSNIAPEADKIDIIGASIALVRVWYTYKLDLGELFRGKIYNTTAKPLSVEDVYNICLILYDQKMYYKEILWLEELVKQVDNGCYTGKTSISRAYKALAGAYFAYGMPWKSLDILTEYLEKDPDNKSVLRDKKYYAVAVDGIPLDQRTLTLQPPEDDRKKEHYEALCRGDIKRPVSLTSKLKCFLKPTLSPLLYAKEEVLNYNPRVSMYYDVITEAEMLFLKNRVIDKLERSVIVDSEDRFEINDVRISQTAWIHDDIAPIVRKYTYRIQLLTGLSSELFPALSHAEELQILNYGIGGMYEPHPDWFGFPLKDLKVRDNDPPMLLGTGDRLATWLTYLNDVEAGGATVFIDLNITVPVVKGAAAFWYNMKRNGECDARTWHAGCPVLIGSKWGKSKFSVGGYVSGALKEGPCLVEIMNGDISD